MLEILAPSVGRVETSDGTPVDVDEKIDGGPSVLYDAVALLPSESGAKELAKMPPARDFLADAVAHQKFVAWGAGARPLLERVCDGEARDQGFIELRNPGDCSTFVERCRALRFWERDPGAT